MSGFIKNYGAPTKEEICAKQYEATLIMMKNIMHNANSIIDKFYLLKWRIVLGNPIFKRLIHNNPSLDTCDAISEFYNMFVDSCSEFNVEPIIV